MITHGSDMRDEIPSARDTEYSDVPSAFVAKVMTDLYEFVRDRHRTMRGHRIVYRRNDRGEAVISLVLPAPRG
jgi:hypothetical protein